MNRSSPPASPTSATPRWFRDDAIGTTDTLSLEPDLSPGLDSRADTSPTRAYGQPGLIAQSRWIAVSAIDIST